MEEVFNSEAFKLRYDEQTNSCVFTLKTYGERDEFRTPMMHAVEMIKKHDCKNLIIEDACEEPVKLNDDDLKWIRKIILPKLKETSCDYVVFVEEENQTQADSADAPYNLFAENFKTDKAVSEKFALMMIQNKYEVSVSPEVSNMTREQALTYMGLPINASDFAIDEKFWILSKQVRGDNSHEGKQRIADLSTAYDIATGRRDERVQKEEERERERKFLGKTADEWRTYFSYTWYKYLIGLILLVLAGNLAYSMITNPGYDSGILAMGHFENGTDYVERFMTTRLGFKNPMVSTVDIVVPNEQGQAQQAYADQTASTLLLSCPNVLIFDEVTLPYYYSNLSDISSLYSYLRENLSVEQFSKIVPVYMSERDAQEIMVEYELVYGVEGQMAVDDIDMSSFDTNPVMIGLRIEDESAIATLGYSNLWPEYDTALIFCVYNQTMDYADSELIIYQLFKEVL